MKYNYKIEDLIKDGRVTSPQINAIVEWLQSKASPIPSSMPAEMIALFLISCCCDVTLAKKTIEAYFRTKQKMPLMFNSRDVDQNESLAKCMRNIYALVLPCRMPGNRGIHFFRLKDTSYSSFDLLNSFKLAYMLIEVSQRNDPPESIAVVIDMKGAGLMHLAKFRLNIVKIFLEFLQTAIPLRIDSIYVLNSNFLFDKILAMIKTFVKSELMGLFKLFPPGYDMKEFFRDEIGACYMPQEYEGELPCLDEINEKTIEVYRELREFYADEEEFRMRAAEKC